MQAGGERERHGRDHAPNPAAGTGFAGGSQEPAEARINTRQSQDMRQRIGPVVEGEQNDVPSGDDRGPIRRGHLPEDRAQQEQVNADQGEVKRHGGPRGDAENRHPAQQRGLVQRWVRAKDIRARDRERGGEGGVAIVAVQQPVDHGAVVEKGVVRGHRLPGSKKEGDFPRKHQREHPAGTVQLHIARKLGKASALVNRQPPPLGSPRLLGHRKP